MGIRELQNKIKEFDVARGWENHWNIKDLLLNITEEGGELWSLIKWIDEDKQKDMADGLHAMNFGEVPLTDNLFVNANRLANRLVDSGTEDTSLLHRIGIVGILSRENSHKKLNLALLPTDKL